MRVCVIYADRKGMLRMAAENGRQEKSAREIKDMMVEPIDNE